MKESACTRCSNLLRHKAMISACESWQPLLANLQEQLKAVEQVLNVAITPGGLPAANAAALQAELKAAGEELMLTKTECNRLESQLQQHNCRAHKNLQRSTQNLDTGVNVLARRVHRLWHDAQDLFHGQCTQGRTAAGFLAAPGTHVAN